MKRIQQNCAIRAMIELIPWYLSVSDPGMPICLPRFSICLRKLLNKDISDSLENFWAIVLNCRHTGHLYRSLYADRKKEAAERRLVGEQLFIGLRLVVVFEGDHILDLIVLSDNPRVRSIAVRMQLCERSEPFLGMAMIDEPPDHC